MPRGAKITPEVDDLITKVCIEHPQWLAKPSKIQQEVIHQLPNSLKDWGGPNWPGIDIIKNRIRNKIKPNLEDNKRLDEPWSIGSLAEYPIPPEVLPSVLKAWIHYNENFIDEKRLDQFSIRMALWASRLAHVLLDIESLAETAYVYSKYERIADISRNGKFDTRLTDIEVYGRMIGNPMILRDADRVSKIVEDWDMANVTRLEEEKFFTHSIFRLMGYTKDDYDKAIKVFNEEKKKNYTIWDKLTDEEEEELLNYLEHERIKRTGKPRHERRR